MYIKKKYLIVLVVLILILAVGVMGNDEKEDNIQRKTVTKTEDSLHSQSTEKIQESEQVESTTENSVASLDEKDTKGYNYIAVEDLDAHNQDIVGKKVLLVGTVGDIQKDDKVIQLNVPNTVHYMDVHLANDSVVLNNIESFKDKTIAVIGTVADEEDVLFFTVSNVIDSYVIAMNSDSYNFRSDKTSPKLAKLFKDKHKDKKSKSDNKKVSKKEYKQSCESFDLDKYKDILRNPDNYNGKKIKLKGKVTQVIEGWFDSFTLYIEDKNGNTWDMNYTYKDNESRKLEGDNITVYGELNGTAKSETILGKQVIYPYVDIEYME